MRILLGAVGYQGATGATGYSGAIDIVGAQGATGAVGYQGAAPVFLNFADKSNLDIDIRALKNNSLIFAVKELFLTTVKTLLYEGADIIWINDGALRYAVLMEI